MLVKVPWVINCEMASNEDYVQAPCGDLLHSYKRDQLFKVTDYSNVEVSKRMNKEELLATLKAQLVELNIYLLWWQVQVPR